ncbi:unnamed protein product [Protopolystoma xenopodis]|uniref:Uncharacterized protein n=1 Tax=Protopolystoma xenopodis TaxID=117903 RepID=A0A3S5A8J6_9PLAT|nr:unnamed protein product [Protopolystoma xenopodis]
MGVGGRTFVPGSVPISSRERGGQAVVQVWMQLGFGRPIWFPCSCRAEEAGDANGLVGCVSRGHEVGFSVSYWLVRFSSSGLWIQAFQQHSSLNLPNTPTFCTCLHNRTGLDRLRRTDRGDTQSTY